MAVAHKERDYKYKLKRDLGAFNRLGEGYAPLLNAPLVPTKYSDLAKQVFSEAPTNTLVSNEVSVGVDKDGDEG